MSENEEQEEASTHEVCRHSILYDFDDTTMTVNNVYEGSRVEALLSDIRFYGDDAIVLDNSIEVTEGELQSGMIVQIYHDGELYSEYVIGDLLNPYSESSDSSSSGISLLSSGNVYKLILPLDGLNIDAVAQNQNLGSNYGGENTVVPDHRGVDFFNVSSGEIYGVPIRAALEMELLK